MLVYCAADVCAGCSIGSGEGYADGAANRRQHYEGGDSATGKAGRDSSGGNDREQLAALEPSMPAVKVINSSRGGETALGGGKWTV